MSGRTLFGGLRPGPVIRSECAIIGGTVPDFTVCGTVSALDGVRATDVYRESLRDCVSRRGAGSTIAGSPGRRSRYPGGRQRTPGLADLCRLRARLIGSGPHPLSPDDRSLAPVLEETDATTTVPVGCSPGRGFGRRAPAVKAYGARPAGGDTDYVHISDGKLHDVNDGPRARRHLPHGPRLRRLPAASPAPSRRVLVTRAKNNLDARRVYSRQRDPANGILSDHLVRLGGARSRKRYPERLRRVRFRDPETNRRAGVPDQLYGYFDALTICNLYRSRWHVELFFKWIKQHLRIKRFFGTSENAVKTQLWIAVSVYVLAAIIRKKLELSIPNSTECYRFYPSCPSKKSLENKHLAQPNPKTISALSVESVRKLHRTLMTFHDVSGGGRSPRPARLSGEAVAGCGRYAMMRHPSAEEERA